MNNLVHHAEDMLAAACRFGLEGMKIVCENFLAEYISKENALNTLKLAKRYHCLKLKSYCLEFIALPYVTRHVLKTISLD
jgi:speckle-type POZ protein